MGCVGVLSQTGFLIKNPGLTASNSNIVILNLILRAILCHFKDFMYPLIHLSLRAFAPSFFKNFVFASYSVYKY